jgi:hypothetical protein
VLGLVQGLEQGPEWGEEQGPTLGHVLLLSGSKERKTKKRLYNHALPDPLFFSSVSFFTPSDLKDAFG